MMRLWSAFKAFFKALRKQQEEAPPNQQESPEERSHLRFLAMLQQSGRLIDFLKEDLSGFTDQQVGAAVRKIHSDCSQLIEELVTVRPVLEDAEGAKIQVPKGYDPSTIKVVGKVKGEPPYEGKLTHRGWQAHKHSLPKRVGESKQEVLQPAEVEV